MGEQEWALDAGDERLDVTSDAFEPALALTHPHKVLLPHPKARAVENIATARQLLPPEAEGSTAQLAQIRHRKTADAEAKAERARARVRNMEQLKELMAHRRSCILPNIISLASKCGPLSVLQRAYEHCHPVVVTTSHNRGVRGRMLASTVAAFDKHMNLLLKRASEEYVVLLRVLRNNHWRKKQERRLRSLPCVFVRGANIIAIRFAHPNEIL